MLWLIPHTPYLVGHVFPALVSHDSLYDFRAMGDIEEIDASHQKRQIPLPLLRPCQRCFEDPDHRDKAQHEKNRETSMSEFAAAIVPDAIRHEGDDGEAEEDGDKQAVLVTGCRENCSNHGDGEGGETFEDVALEEYNELFHDFLLSSVSDNKIVG